MSERLLPDLFAKISTFVKSNARLVVHSDLTQSMATDPNVVLWNTEPIDDLTKDLLKEFETAAYKKKCKFWSIPIHELRYHEFCIALICANRFSLNHNIVNRITSRSFLSAWRTITVISQINKALREWLQKHLGGRTNTEYSNNLGVKLNNMAMPTNMLRCSTPSPTLVSDDIILTMACDSREVVSIGPGEEFDINMPVAKHTRMNEGQLMNLVMVHEISLSTIKQLTLNQNTT